MPYYCKHRLFLCKKGGRQNRIIYGTDCPEDMASYIIKNIPKENRENYACFTTVWVPIDVFTGQDN